MRILSSFGAFAELPELRIETLGSDVIVLMELPLIPAQCREPLDDLYHIRGLLGFLPVAALNQLVNVLLGCGAGAQFAAEQLFVQYLLNLLDSGGK